MFTKKEYRKKLLSFNNDTVTELMRHGYSNSQISSNTGISINKVSNYRRNYDGEKSLMQHKTSGRKLKFKNVYIKRFKQFIQDNNNACLSVREMKANFESLSINKDIKELNLSISTYYYWSTHRRGLNHSWKRVKKYCSVHEDNFNLKIERKIFCKKLFYLMSQGYRIIYLDECAINLNFKPSYGYRLKGKPLYLPWTSPKSTNITYIGAIDDKGILAYKLIKGSMGGVEFYDFLLDMIEKKDLYDEKTVFILDNLSSHKSKGNLFKDYK
jgi:transposase